MNKRDKILIKKAIRSYMMVIENLITPSEKRDKIIQTYKDLYKRVEKENN